MTHRCDRCGAGFEAGAPDPDEVAEIEVDHFLATGCRGAVVQVAPTPTEVFARRMREIHCPLPSMREAARNLGAAFGRIDSARYFARRTQRG